MNTYFSDNMGIVRPGWCKCFPGSSSTWGVSNARRLVGSKPYLNVPVAPARRGGIAADSQVVPCFETSPSRYVDERPAKRTLDVDFAVEGLLSGSPELAL